METISSLLEMVLMHHYNGRLNELNLVLHIIEEYADKDSAQNDYEEVVNLLREKMSDLPDDIVSYFVMLTPIPKHCTMEYKHFVAKELQEWEISGRIRKALVEYLNDQTAPLLPTKEHLVSAETKLDVPGTSQAEEIFIKPKRKPPGRPRKVTNQPKECKNLLNICVEYIVNNELMLKEFYRKKNKEAWRLLYTGKYDKEKLHEVIKYVNRKNELLRYIERDEIPAKFIYEEHQESYDSHDIDPTELTKELKDAVEKFVYG